MRWWCDTQSLIVVKVLICAWGKGGVKRMDFNRVKDKSFRHNEVRVVLRRY